MYIYERLRGRINAACRVLGVCVHTQSHEMTHGEIHSSQHHASRLNVTDRCLALQTGRANAVCPSPRSPSVARPSIPSQRSPGSHTATHTQQYRVRTQQRIGFRFRWQHEGSTSPRSFRTIRRDQMRCKMDSLSNLVLGRRCLWDDAQPLLQCPSEGDPRRASPCSFKKSIKSHCILSVRSLGGCTKHGEFLVVLAPC